MNSSEQVVDRPRADLRDISLERVVMPGDSVLARSLALYRKRLAEGGTLYSAFDSSI